MVDTHHVRVKGDRLIVLRQRCPALVLRKVVAKEPPVNRIRLVGASFRVDLTVVKPLVTQLLKQVGLLEPIAMYSFWLSSRPRPRRLTWLNM